MEEDSPVAIQVLEEPENGRKRITFRAGGKSHEESQENQQRRLSAKSPRTPTIHIGGGGASSSSSSLSSPRSPVGSSSSPFSSGSGKKPEEKLKNKMMNVWNNMKYGSGFAPATFQEESPIWLLGRCYFYKELKVDDKVSDSQYAISSLEQFYSDFISRLWMTYRRDFSPIYGSGLTTDCGWGCMLRSSQMLLASALVFHFLTRDWRINSRTHTTEETFYYFQILRWFGDEMTEYCPFSIHNFVEVGLKLDKKAGDWYGPYSAAQIIKDSVDKAIRLYPPLDALRVYVAQDCVVCKEEIMELCTKPVRYQGIEQSVPEDFWAGVIILVPIRLGGDHLNPIYIPCIKSILTLDQCVGIIGGKPRHSVTFIGFQDNKLIYLDPHYNQMIVDIHPPSFNTRSYHCTTPRKMSFSKMDPSCTMGFYCRTREEFERFCKVAPGVLHPPMQRGHYPMFVFADKRDRTDISPTLQSSNLLKVENKHASLSLPSLSGSTDSLDDEPDCPRSRSQSVSEDYVLL
ncbi:Cysteine protease ATG4D [Trichoplax sp. H2]|nr:Cysteine protease ATG4D [Trichoplax sp. H2]|eukprot:RDD38013.1 Cysteine protease ATG4D [Trichoplax sp. H2]